MKVDDSKVLEELGNVIHQPWNKIELNVYSNYCNEAVAVPCYQDVSEATWKGSELFYDPCLMARQPQIYLIVQDTDQSTHQEIVGL